MKEVNLLGLSFHPETIDPRRVLSNAEPHTLNRDSTQKDCDLTIYTIFNNDSTNPTLARSYMGSKLDMVGKIVCFQVFNHDFHYTGEYAVGNFIETASELLYFMWSGLSKTIYCFIN